MKVKVLLITIFLIILMNVISYAALDLIFSSEITLAPSSPNSGATVTFSVTFRSLNAAVTNMKIIGGIDGVQKFEKTYNSIPKNGMQTDSFSWTATEGSHKVFFTLDPAHTTADSNTANNTIEKQFNVSTGQNPSNSLNSIKALSKVYQLKPDLKVDSVVWSPLEDPKCGKKWRMGVIIVNDGKVAVTKSFTVALSIEGILVDDHVMNGLYPGQKVGFNYDWYIYNNAYVRVVADFHNTVDESKEDNNAKWPKVECVN